MSKSTREISKPWFEGRISFKEEKDPKMEEVIKEILLRETQIFYFQLERGENGDKLFHYQFLFRCNGEKDRSTGQRKKFWDKMKTKIGGLKGDHLATCGERHDVLQRYVTKCETRIAGPWSNRRFYTGRKVNMMLANIRPWQQSVMNILRSMPDLNIIHYVYDPDGGSGKSTLMAWAEDNHLGIGVPLYDPKQVISAVIEEGDHPAYFLDLPRTIGKSLDLNGFYTSIEKIKDGRLRSAMNGKSKKLRMDPPHVFVFSNMLPNLSKLSDYKWKCWSVTKPLYELIPLNQTI